MSSHPLNPDRRRRQAYENALDFLRQNNAILILECIIYEIGIRECQEQHDHPPAMEQRLSAWYNQGWDAEAADSFARLR